MGATRGKKASIGTAVVDKPPPPGGMVGENRGAEANETLVHLPPTAGGGPWVVEGEKEKAGQLAGPAGPPSQPGPGTGLAVKFVGWGGPGPTRGHATKLGTGTHKVFPGRPTATPQGGQASGGTGCCS